MTSLLLILTAVLSLSPLSPPAGVPRSPVGREVSASGAPLPVVRWLWPLRPGPAVVRGFVVGPQPWSPGHRGVDLAGATGQPVLTPFSGTVAFAGVVAGTPVVSIDHGEGVVSSFEPVRARVRRGQSVGAGAELGDLLGGGPGSHCLPRACLHWGVRRDGTYIDPLQFLGAGPAVLLPMQSVTR